MPDCSKRGRVGDSLSRDVRRRTVHRLKHCAFLADVCTRHQAQTADQPSTQIRHDVAVKIFQQHHVKLFRPHHQLHARVVDDLVVSLNLGKLGGHFSEAIEEESVGQFHDVCFMTAGYFLAALAPRILESKSRNASGSFLRNDLQALDHAGNHNMLQPRIQTFRILTNNNQVEFGIAAGNIWQRADGPQVRVQIERFSQAHVDGSEAFADGRSDRPLERNLVSQDRIKQCLRQGFAKFFQRLRAGVVSFPFNLYARSFNDAHYVCSDFGADAIAGNQCDTMFHKSI